MVRRLLRSIAMASLLDQLGGRDGLTVVVAGLVARLAAAPDHAGRWDDADRARDEASLVDALAAALDGASPLPATGRAARIASATFVACLIETLAAAGVGSALSREVVVRVARVRHVERAGGL